MCDPKNYSSPFLTHCIITPIVQSPWALSHWCAFSSLCRIGSHRVSKSNHWVRMKVLLSCLFHVGVRSLTKPPAVPPDRFSFLLVFSCCPSQPSTLPSSYYSLQHCLLNWMFWKKKILLLNVSILVFVEAQSCWFDWKSIIITQVLSPCCLSGVEKQGVLAGMEYLFLNTACIRSHISKASTLYLGANSISFLPCGDSGCSVCSLPAATAWLIRSSTFLCPALWCRPTLCR